MTPAVYSCRKDFPMKGLVLAWVCLLLVLPYFSLGASATATTGMQREGFSVRKLRTITGLTLQGQARVKFQGELMNFNASWDNARGEFSAPVDGAYFFAYNAISSKDSDFTLALMKNGENQVTAYGGGPRYEWAGNSALLQLKRGDRVYLELLDGTIYEHPGSESYTTFSGFLVFPVN